MPRIHVSMIVLGAVVAGAPAQQELRAAQTAYGEERFADALALVKEGLAAAPGDAQLLMIGAWCQLQLAASEPERLRKAEAWFDEITEGRARSEIPSQALLGLGRCQLLLADAAPEGTVRRLHLQEADRALSALIARDDQLRREALRRRTEVRLASGATEDALSDARAFEKLVSDQCAQIEGRLIASRIVDYRRELEQRLASRRAELWSLQARVALHQWNVGDHDAARQRIESLLSETDLAFEEPAVAELLARVAPDDPRVARAHVFLLEHGASSVQRSEAALALGQLGHAGCSGQPALVRAARGSDLVVARAAVTALGMLGPHAWDATELLEGLTQHEDAQLAGRAEAALRSIRAKDR